MAATKDKSKLDLLTELVNTVTDEDLKPLEDAIAAKQAELDQLKKRKKSIYQILGKPLKKPNKTRAHKTSSTAPSPNGNGNGEGQERPSWENVASRRR